MTLREKKKRQIAKHFAENDWKPARSALKRVYITEPGICYRLFILRNTTFNFKPTISNVEKTLLKWLLFTRNWPF